MKTIKWMLLGFLFSISLIQCDRGPKIITPSVRAEGGDETGIFSEKLGNKTEPKLSNKEGVHIVKIVDILPTEKYVYLEVEEKDKSFWIATSKRVVQKDEIYFYRGGLLKTDFKSKEYNRVFDTLYLVSNIVLDSHGSNLDSIDTTMVGIETHSSFVVPDTEKYRTKEVVRIVELVNNPKAYVGELVTLKGECVKINSNIMGRNWIHLKDGSMDDYDFVITTDIIAQVGSTISIRGKVAVEKDFGAGYKYDIIVEECELVKSL